MRQGAAIGTEKRSQETEVRRARPHKARGTKTQCRRTQAGMPIPPEHRQECYCTRLGAGAARLQEVSHSVLLGAQSDGKWRDQLRVRFSRRIDIGAMREQ